MDVRFKVPSNFYISGQSQCGKSYLVRRLLYYLNELFHPVPSKVIYCYGEYQKEFDELHGVEFIEGFPEDLNALTQGHEQTLLVLDDLMSECSKDQRVSDLFTRGSHHKGISVLYLTQNLFPPGKLSRTISLNSITLLCLKIPEIPWELQRWPNRCSRDEHSTLWIRFMMLLRNLLAIYLSIVILKPLKIYVYEQTFSLEKDI